MSAFGQFLLPIGFFLALIGVVLATNSPFMREMLGQVEFLQKNRRVVGTVLAVIGLALMWLSTSV
jgi:hypothetical protein